jgi:exosortase
MGGIALAAASLLACALFAYRALLSWDPSAALRDRAEGTEALLFEPAGGSPVLVFGVAAWMAWRRRQRLARAVGSARGSWLAALLLPPSAALALWAYYVEAPDLLVPSLVLLLPGLGALLGGRAGARALLLPGIFLVFAVPLPAALVNEIVFPLQLFTADLTAGALALLGRPAVLNGDLIRTGERVFQVIESCSGLRLMETLVMASVVYAELLGRRPLWTFALVLLAPPVGMVVNVLRVLSIVLNPYSSFAAVHTAQGIVMLVAGVVALAALDRGLEALAPAAAARGARGDAAPAGAAGGSPRRRLAAACGVLALLGLATLAVDPWRPPGSSLRTLSDVPIALGAWRATPLKLDRNYLGTVSFSERTYRRYHDGDRVVDLFVGIDDRLARHGSLVSVKTELLEAGVEVEQRAAATQTGVPGAQWLLLRSPAGLSLALHWYEGVDPVAVEVGRSLVALDRGPWRRAGAAKAVRLSTPVDGSIEVARERLRAFLPEARAALDALERPPGA